MIYMMHIINLHIWWYVTAKHLARSTPTTVLCACSFMYSAMAETLSLIKHITSIFDRCHCCHYSLAAVTYVKYECDFYLLKQNCLNNSSPCRRYCQKNAHTRCFAPVTTCLIDRVNYVSKDTWHRCPCSVWCKLNSLRPSDAYMRQ